MAIEQEIKVCRSFKFNDIWVCDVPNNTDFLGEACIMNVSNSRATADDYIILLKQDFYDLYTIDEQLIILYHEYGHFEFREKNQFSDEMHADLYAYYRYGKTKVIELLKKMMTIHYDYDKCLFEKRLNYLNKLQ